MKHCFQRFLRFSFPVFVFTVAVCVTFGFSQIASAATGINSQIHFQGKVVSTNGTNVSDGNYNFVFSIYTVASGGSAIWTESRTGGDQVAVTDGIFSLELGSLTALPGSVDFNTDNIYLGIDFNGDGEMTPRVRFTAAPYAMNAGKVAGLTVTNTTGTLTVPSGKTVAFADAFTTSGANPLTLSTTGITSLTLPVSGTLLTNTATSNQTVTSTQTSGTVFGLADSTALTGAVTGLSVTLSGTGAQNQTGLQFNLSGATGTNLNDILGSGSTWQVSRAGSGQFASIGIGTAPARTLDINGALRVRTSATPGTPVTGDVYNSGTSLFYYNGTAWQDLGLNSTPGSTNGAVQFNSSSAFGGDSANFFWDNTNKRLGIGTNTPAQALSLNGQALFMPQGGVSTKGYRAYSGRIGSPSLDDRLVFINDSGTDARYWFDSQSATSGFSVANGGLEQAYFGTTGGAFTYVIYQNQPFNIDMGASGNTAWTITPSGEVGIGTTAPSGRLHAYVSNTAVTTNRYDGYFENLATNATTNAINKYGLYVTSTGSFVGGAATDTNNYGMYVNSVSGADFNYLAAYGGASGAHAAFLKDLSAAFGSYSETGANIDRNSYIGEEWSRERANVTADIAFAWGDNQGWATDEQANTNNDCTFSTVDDETNGVGRMTVADINTTCNSYHSSGAIGNLHLQFTAGNLPVMLMKVRPNAVGANDDTWVGLQDQTNLTTNADPTNGIFFGNNNGNTWTGFTRSAGTSTPVACTGQTVSTTQFALLKAEVISTSQVRFYVDNDVSNGVNWTYCGESTTNIPAAALGSMLKFRSSTAANYLDVDFYRFWQDDTSKPATKRARVSEDEILLSDGVMYFEGETSSEKKGDSLRIATLEVDETQKMLQQIQSLPVSFWEVNDGGVTVRHISPDAQVFFDQFALGREGTVSAMDVAGIALLASKGMASRMSILEGDQETVLAQIALLSDKMEKVSDLLALRGNFGSQEAIEKQGGLTVNGPLRVAGEASFDNIVAFAGKATFTDQVIFEKIPTWSKDTAGYAKISEGSDRVFVAFGSPYEEAPVVNITRITKDNPDSFDSAKEKNRLFDEKYTYLVADARPEGFTILLNKKAKEEVLFSWNAFFVSDTKIQQGSKESGTVKEDARNDDESSESNVPSVNASGTDEEKTTSSKEVNETVMTSKDVSMSASSEKESQDDGDSTVIIEASGE